MTASLSSPLSVLIADDDRDMCQLIGATLHKAGYDVRLAADGDEAYEMALAHTPDIIVSDICMPRRDGWQLTVDLRTTATTACTPILFVSKLAGRWERVRAFRIGADDYLTKPFRGDDLVRRVERAWCVAEAERVHFAQPAHTGRLERTGFLGLMMMLESQKQTGRLRVDSGISSATMLVDDGRLVASTLSTDPQLGADECVFRAVGWSEGHYAFVAEASVRTQPSTDAISISSLLRKAAKRNEVFERERRRRKTDPSLRLVEDM